MEYKDFQVEIKQVQEGKNLYIEGYGAVFGNLDSYKDIIAKGAFMETISGKNGKRIAFCFQHDFKQVIGKLVELREDEYGLYFKAKVSNTTLGKDVAILVSDEALNEISIGYMAKESNYNAETNVRTLTNIELFERSIVTRAANDEAIIGSTEVKASIEDKTDEELIKLKQDIDREYLTRIFKRL